MNWNFRKLTWGGGGFRLNLKIIIGFEKKNLKKINTKYQTNSNIISLYM